MESVIFNGIKNEVKFVGLQHSNPEFKEWSECHYENKPINSEQY